jgi:hypothetical protein
MTRAILLVSICLLAAWTPRADAQDAADDAPTYPVVLIAPDAGSVVEPEGAAIVVSLHRLPALVDRQTVRLFVGGADVTERAGRHGAFLTYRPDAPLAPGRVALRVALRDTTGRFLQAVDLPGFGVSGPRLADGQRSGGLPPTSGLPATPGFRQPLTAGFLEAAEVRLETRAEAGGPFAEQYARGGVDVRGQAGPLRFGALLLLDSQTRAGRQSQHRFRFAGDLPFGDYGGLRLRAGDTYPRLPELFGRGQRVRGVDVGLRLGPLGLDVAAGSARRSAEARLLTPVTGLTRTEFLQRPVNSNPLPAQPVAGADSLYGYTPFIGGAYDRRYVSIRPTVGDRRSFEAGLTFLRIGDDPDSGVLVAGRPEENVVIGTDFFMGLDRRRIRLEAETALSLTNTDASGGAFTDADIDSIRATGELTEDQANLLLAVRDFGELLGFTVNENVYPVNPVGSGLPAIAAQGELAVDYGQNLLQVKAFRRGVAYRTLANPFLQSDRQGLRISDRLRLLDGRVVAQGAFGRQADNTGGTRPATTLYSDGSGSVSIYDLRRGLSFSVGGGLFGRQRDAFALPTSEPDSAALAPRLDDGVLRLFVTAGLGFTAADARHQALFSVNRLTRDDRAAADLDTETFTVQTSVASRLQRRALRTRFGLSYTTNRFRGLTTGQAARTGYAGLTGELSVGFYDERLRLTGGLTQYLGDIRRTLLRTGADLSLKSGHAVGGRVLFYGNADADDNVVATVNYRYRL